MADVSGWEITEEDWKAAHDEILRYMTPPQSTERLTQHLMLWLRDRLRARNEARTRELEAELRALIPRFRACIIASGSDPEFADEAVASARRVLNDGEEVEGG